MTIRHMKIFLQVYQTQNITHAAQQLHMTQPAVTRAIQELERYYGVRLFERMNKRLYVTESGKELYAQALHIADAFDRMEKSLRSGNEYGVLRVGASITLGNFLMPRLVSAFQKRYPQRKVCVTVCNGTRLQQSLLENQLDLALIEGEAAMPHLHAEPFAQDRLVLILPPEHPLCQKEQIKLRDLACCDFLLREQGSAGRTFLDQVFAAQGMPIQPRWESTSTQAIIKAVGCGLGISLLPEQLVQADIRAGTVKTRPLADQSFLRTHYIVWHENKYLTACAQDFIQCSKAAGALPQDFAAKLAP